MSQSWDAHADGWDANPDVILYSERAYNSLIASLDPRDLEVLDFGCGTGLMTGKIAATARRVVGLDSSAKMIAVLAAKALSNVDTFAGELSDAVDRAGDLFFPGRFDLIVASSVCAFVADYEETLRGLQALLKPGGVFMQWDWLSSGDGSDSGLTEDMIRAAFDRTGLRTVLVKQAFAMEGDEGPMPVIMGQAQK